MKVKGFPQKVELCNKLIKEAESFRLKLKRNRIIDNIVYIDDIFYWSMEGTDKTYYYFTFDRLPIDVKKHLIEIIEKDNK